MDKIFADIKRAIEEEMAKQEGGRTSAPPRPTGPGDREAERYREWVKQEQDRLRAEDEPEGSESSEAPRAERYDGRRAEGTAIDSHGPPGREEREWAPERPQPQQSQNRRQPTETRRGRARDSAYLQRGHGHTAEFVRRQLRASGGVRHAILMSEIIGKPVSMRRDDEHLIG